MRHLLNKILNMNNASIEEKQNLITVYMAMVKFVDDSIGTILDKLEDLIIEKNEEILKKRFVIYYQHSLSNVTIYFTFIGTGK